MDRRDRLVVGALWIGVAALMAITIDFSDPTAAGSIARGFVVVLAVFLAVVYVLDPWDVLENRFH